MTEQALVNARVLLKDGFVDGQAVLVRDGRIAAIVDKSEIPEDADQYDLGGRMLVPGFIDTQVNGGGNHLFNNDPSVETIAKIGAAHRQFGTTGFLPTLISDDAQKIRLAIDAVRAAIAEGVPGVLGIHIEGPFLNPVRKGIHDETKIRPLGDEEFSLITTPTGGRTIVTVAPEIVGEAMVRRLTDAGVIVSAGHTQATAQAIFGALRSGLRGFTHLFNAMSQISPREPGAAGAALYDDASWCGIIVDGHHVDPVVLKLALRTAPARRFMLVTDAMPSVGGRKSFVLNGQDIEVTGGKCVNADGTLAGSDLDMASAVRNTVSLLGVTIEQAIEMASANPAAFLGLDHDVGRIAVGQTANFVLLDEHLQVVETWIDGRASGRL